EEESGKRAWMNASTKSVTDAYTGHTGYGSFTFDFPMKPTLNRTLVPNQDVEYNIVVTVHLEADPDNPLSPLSPLRNVWIELTIGDRETRSDAPDNVEPGYITFNLRSGRNQVPPQTHISLTLHFEVVEATYSFYTDGTSNIDLKLLEDTDFDGDPDTTDPDDDGDGFSDEKEIEEGTDPKDPNSKPSEREEELMGQTYEPITTCLILSVALTILIVCILILYYVKKKKA
ncbi:MAG: hypothetical protein JSW28_03760, partial [Thermoplasmata archaeon]